MSKWIDGRVVKLHRWTDRLYSLQVEADLPAFTAGQFTRLALDIDGEMIARPYSFVNPPDNPVHEFYFITVPGGPLSNRMITLQPGDHINVAPRGAGFLLLSEIPDAENLWLLSTGTAIGPFLSILGTPEAWRRFRNIVLVHAVRTEAELTYTGVIDDLLSAHPEQMQYVPFVSREDIGYAMKGRVPAAIADGALESRTGLELTADNSQVMICGNPSMVKDTRVVLEARGLRKNKRNEPGQITTEQYWKA